jgi:hypothetical protein
MSPGYLLKVTPHKIAYDEVINVTSYETHISRVAETIMSDEEATREEDGIMMKDKDNQTKKAPLTSLLHFSILVLLATIWCHPQELLISFS